MEHVIDLDALASRLQSVMGEWRRWATVSLLTWRDEADPWPRTIKEDRSSVQVPESVGFTLHKHGSDDVFEVVVWAGGWADVGFLIDGEVYNFSPTFSDVGGAYGAVVKDVEDFLA
ncbi:hypothetical protein [Promicromonospora sukumoe]|uniref:hypothetical protein n=1 Tax=Promicromonospora sukumoe TaxID=88382 RepID=UPI003652AFDB